MDLGLERAGMRPLWMCEIDQACREVLRFHWPHVPIYPDMTLLDLLRLLRPDILCGGTPCQGFSAAGLRGSLEDDRSNLCLQFIKIANALNPRILIWENVPGVLSTKDNAFGCFLAGLVGADAPLLPPESINRWRPGKGGRYFSWTSAGMVAGPRRNACWRTLDSQFFGVAQRRERVFVVCDTGTGCAEKILFEWQSRGWNHPPGRETGQAATYSLSPSLSASGPGTGRTGETRGQDCLIPEVAKPLGAHALSKGRGTDLDNTTYIPIAGAVSSKWSKGTGGPAADECYNLVAHTLRGEGCDASEDRTGRGTPIIPFDTTQITSKGNVSNPKPGDPCHPLAAGAHPPCIASCEPIPIQEIGKRQSGTAMNGVGHGEPGDPMFTLQATAVHGIQQPTGVRRLTPLECERLQGYPDEHTLNAISEKTGKPYQQKDTARYKQCGNGVTATVAEWIGRRIEKFIL